MVHTENYLALAAIVLIYTEAYSNISITTTVDVASNANAKEEADQRTSQDAHTSQPHIPIPNSFFRSARST